MRKSVWVMFILLFCAGCSNQKSPETEVSPPADADTGREGPVESEPKLPSEPASKIEKTEGAYTVLGLEIPERMQPVKAPSKVFRFEGFVGLEQAIDAMKAQIRPKWTKPYASGVVYEEARVKAPKGKGKGKDLLNIRIYKSKKGGAVIDIWVAASGDMNQAKELKLHREKSKGSRYQQRRISKSGQKTLKVMNKKARQETPSKEDLNSPFYY